MTKPDLVGGLPRCGTTALTRQLYRQKVIDEADPPGYCDELFRILPTVFEIYWDEKPRMIPIQKNYKEALILDTEKYPGQEYMFPTAGTNPSLSMPYLKARVDSFKKYKEGDFFGKVFPMDFEIISSFDKKYVKNLLLNYHWHMCWREDWFDLLVSLFYSAEVKQFHVFDNHDFLERKVFLNPLRVDEHLSNVFELLYKWTSKDMDTTWYSLDDIKSLEENWNNMPKDKVPVTNWLVSPRVVKDKKKKMENLVVNYEQFRKRSFKRVEHVLNKCNGLFVLSEDKEKIHLDISKLKEKSILC